MSNTSNDKIQNKESQNDADTESIIDFTSQKALVKKQISASRFMSLMLFGIGLALVLSVPLIFRIFPLKDESSCHCEYILLANCIIDTAVIIAAITCFLIGGGKLNTMAAYEMQLLKLNDLKVAIKLLKNLDSEQGAAILNHAQTELLNKYRPSEKDKAKQQIITTLLNSYTG